MIPVAAASFLLGSLLLAPASSPARSETDAPDSPELTEERFEALAASFETEARRMRENPEADEVLLAEAEAIAAVAEEFHAEGDLETSIPLLEDALALLEIPPPRE